MSKELWCDAYEQLEYELGREPTDEEVQSRLESYACDAYDYVKDREYDND